MTDEADEGFERRSSHAVRPAFLVVLAVVLALAAGMAGLHVLQRDRGESAREALTAPGSHGSWPPTPAIVVIGRTDEHVLIRYSFESLPRDGSGRPMTLVTSIDASGTRYAPLSEYSPILSASGTVVQRLGLGTAPYILRWAVVAWDGTRSETREIGLPD